MTRATIDFHSLLQDTQNYASFDQNDDHMVSVIQFDLRVDSRTYAGMTVEVRQPFGTNFESEPMEVGQTKGDYRGPWNHAEFAVACEKYVRSFIGSQGSGIRIDGGRDIKMRNTRVLRPASAEFDIPDAASEAW